MDSLKVDRSLFQTAQRKKPTNYYLNEKRKCSCCCTIDISKRSEDVQITFSRAQFR